MEEEKNNNQEEKEKKSLKKLKFRLPGVKAAGAVYGALALCVVTVMVLSIYSVSDPKKFDTEIDISIPQVIIPEKTLKDDTSKPTEVPVTKEKDDVPADTSEDTPTVTPQPVYTNPADGKIEKGYHMTSLVYSETMKDYRTHSGVDISGKIGDAVKCYTDGVVSSVRDDPFMGKTVEITHQYGLISVYQNLSNEIPSNVYVGSEIKSGDIIGAIGNTAIMESADDPHVHFELILDGKNIDCEKELK